MTEKKLEHNADCASQAHDKHLCFLMYEGYHFDHPGDYKQIVQDARFRCQRVLFKLHLIGCMRYEFFIFWPF